VNRLRDLLLAVLPAVLPCEQPFAGVTIVMAA
jgi:hypothetical protein